MLISFRPNTLNVDLPASAVADNEFTAVSNYVIRDGIPRRAEGWAEIFAGCPITPQWLLNAQSDGVNYWIACGVDGMAITDTTTWSDITPVGYVAADDYNQWTGGLLNGIPIINCGNRKNVPWYFDWSDTATLKPLPGWDEDWTCDAIRPFKNHIFALAMQETSVELLDKLRWSAAAPSGSVPSEWVATDTNQAGSTDLGGGRTPIIDAAILRNKLYIYKPQTVFAASFVGGAFVYSFQKVFSNRGILTRNCAVEFQGTAFVLGDGDAYRHDGQNLVSLVEKRGKKALFSQISPVSFPASYVVVDKENDEVLFCVPFRQDTQPNLAVVIGAIDGNIGVRSIDQANFIASGVVDVAGFVSLWDTVPGSWAANADRWNVNQYNAANDGLLMANERDDKIYELNRGNTQAGVPMVAYMDKTDMALGDPNVYKRVTRIWPKIVDTVDATYTISVGAAKNANTGTYQFVSYGGFDPNTQEYIDLSELPAGRYFEVRIGTFDVAAPSSVLGYDLEVAEVASRY